MEAECGGDYSDVEVQVASLLSSHNLDGWVAFIKNVFEQSVSTNVVKAVITRSLQQLQEEAGKSHIQLAIDAGKTMLAFSKHRSVACSAELSEVRGSIADWCVQLGNEEEAQEMWRSMLPSIDHMASLKVLNNLLNSAIRACNYHAVETECLRGIAPYKALSMRPEANEVVNNFLHAFASILVARNHFPEASQRFYELYRRTKGLSHLRSAIVCAIQAEASATRSRLLNIFHRDENSVLLGELHNILTRASHTHVLRPCDLQHFLPYVEASSDAVAVVQGAFIQHNLQAISRIYYNIGFTELGAILGIPATEAEKIVARMVSERRLDASLDQITETVVFGQPDKSSVLETWDTKISLLCKELDATADLITSRHPEFNKYLLK